MNERLQKLALLAILICTVGCMEKHDIDLAEGRPTSKIGEGLYQEHCLSCHGAEGTGGGEMVERDLVRSPKLFTSETFNPIVLEGIKKTSMRSYRSILAPVQVESIRLYLSELREGVYERK